MRIHRSYFLTSLACLLAVSAHAQAALTWEQVRQQIEENPGVEAKT